MISASSEKIGGCSGNLLGGCVTELAHVANSDIFHACIRRYVHFLGSYVTLKNIADKYGQLILPLPLSCRDFQGAESGESGDKALDCALFRDSFAIYFEDC